MKNYDYNIGKEYQVSIYSLLELRERIMNDNDLKEEDILNHYMLGNTYNIKKNVLSLTSNEEYKTDLYNMNMKTDLFEKYWLMKKGLLKDFQIKKIKGLLSLKDFILRQKEIPSDILPNLESEDEMKLFIKNNSSYFMFAGDKVYTDVSYFEALKDVYNYNKELYLKQLEIEDAHFLQGLENSPIVINITSDGKYELIDGFYRVLYKKIDKTALVKVYNNISNEDWMKLMLNFNFWKTNVSKSMFYDRGFLIGLRIRFNINLEDYIYPYIGRTHNINLIKILTTSLSDFGYISAKEFKEALENNDLTEKDKTIFKAKKDSFKKITMLNKFFIRDLDIFKHYINYDLQFIKTNKKLNDRNFLKETAYEELVNNIFKLINNFRIIYSDEEMNELPVNLLDILMENKEIKDSFSKALTMTTPGFIENRMKGLLPLMLIELKKILLVK